MDLASEVKAVRLYEYGGPENLAVEGSILTYQPDGLNFGYRSVFPDEMFKLNPTVTVTPLLARPDASKVREFADDVRDGTFVRPISRRIPFVTRAGRTHWRKEVA